MNRHLLAVLGLPALGLLIAPAPTHAVPPPGGVEGIHGNVPGFPTNSCYVCHDIAPGATGRDAVMRPNLTCLGCHTDGPTYGEGDPLIEDRPHATPVGDHANLVTGSDRFTYGDFGIEYPYPGYEEQIHCTTCHDPHRTFDPADPDPSTYNTMYIRDHTDDYYVDNLATIIHLPYKEMKVVDNTGAQPVEFTKLVDQDIVYTGPADFADGIGMLAAETNVCEVCHTLTNHHQVDDTAPGGQSHYDGEDCTACHTHPGGFGIGGYEPLTGPHAMFGDPDCGACHDVANFPGNAGNPGGLASVFCADCHDPASVASLHSHTVTGTGRFDYTLECTACHDQHGWELTNIEGGENIRYVKARVTEHIEVIDHTAGDALVVKDIDSDVVFMDAGDFDDGDMVYTEDICNTCHTLTDHHQNDGSAPGGQSHFDGQDCTGCHAHGSGFGGFGGPHPQAGTDCSNCHLGPEGEPDLVSIHGGDCSRCHTDGIPSTFLGPAGTWDQTCEDCHNPTISRTGAMEVLTKGHRCVVCHGQQMPTSGSESIHWNHAEDANCVVCHGFVPSMGTEIGSGNRDLCQLCHGNASGSIRTIHEMHSEKGLSCLECHGGERPPVDVVFGPPVGNSDIVCETCHDYEHDSPRDIHEKHVDMLLDCGSCHIDANLQDDRVPMPPVDDQVRAMVNRSGTQECFLCHESESASTVWMHKKHARQGQWCYNCHEGDDERPVGASGPATEPAESCQICHNGHHYNDEFPFAVHARHAGDVKCYSCHQATPPLSTWPRSWLGGDVTGVELPAQPVVSRLSLGAYPNPFNAKTTISFELREASPVYVFVYDVRGQRVAELAHNDHRAAGRHELAFEPRLASGVYFVRLMVGSETLSKKILLLK